MRKLIFEPVTYSGRLFSIFRICLGLYLLNYFIGLFPYVGDLYASNGVFPFHPDIPFLNFLWAEKERGQISLIVLAICALFFTLGFQRRFFAFVLWLGWASLLLRLPFLNIPSETYVGWMILASLATPAGEPWAISRQKPDWQMPTPLYWGAWVVLGLSYSISGYEKWLSTSWKNGEALRFILDSPVANTLPFKDWALASPDWMIRLGTWGALFLEAFYFPLVFFTFTRKWAWTAMTIMHFSLLLFLNGASVTSAMLIMQLFVLNERWLTKKSL